MIMELLDAFGIPTAGAAGFEADDVLGTLAARERTDPVVVVSGDRDLLQVVADDPVPVRVLYLGRGLTKATLFGPAEVAEHYGVPRGPGRAGLRRTGAVARRSVRRAARRAGRRGEDGGHPAGPARLAGADPGRRPRPKVQDGQGFAGQTAGARPTTSRSPARWCGWPPTRRSRCRRRTDALPLAAADPKRTAELATELGVGSPIARLQKALDALPGVTRYCGRPTS